MLYDVDRLLKELNINDEHKKELIKELKDEFPHDEILFELHLYRVVQFLKKQNAKK